MEQRDGGDFPLKNPLVMKSEAGKKLVRQLDFTGFSDGAAASSVENPQLVKPRQPTIFMTMQQPTQQAVPFAQHPIRTLSKLESPRTRPRQNVNDVKDGTPKKQKQCNCKHSRCLKFNH